ncbi:uncharacterized protein [Triticum aestivum]|uniref:uncharacterized protein n=1 Tax=Triticum aestivum TaxID=4565 RepID=UPI000843AF86|nr:uncharacterized protein LOC123065236 [Triticum aestivum]XP_044344513.1 uncharacterized protein LOC123065236 [Triticum aestivum]XP_044344514.1 uncharacterized protein LOC123065236 [Triticum aestivum]
MATIAFRLLSRRTLTSAIGKAAEHLPQGRWSWRSYLIGFDDTAMAEAKRRLGHASYMKLLEKEQAAVDRTLGRLVFGSAVVSFGLLLAKIILLPRQADVLPPLLQTGCREEIPVLFGYMNE